MSIWQTKIWWEMLKKSNQVEKIIEYNNIFIEKRKVSLWEYWLFILWIEWVIDENTEKELVKICLEEKALFIQIENIAYNWVSEIKTNKFKSGYYKKFITPYTAIIDLQKTEEEILNEMKPKGRYNIKLAEKKWVVVKIVEKNDENIGYFYDIMNETTSRDWFNWNTFDYYKIFLNTLENSKLLLAYYEDKIIAWWIFIFESEVSIYYYWASSGDKNHRNLMSPYLLQWEAIKYAKNMWSKIYDFLWIATPWEKNSPLEWVTDFKLKLTKDTVNISKSVIYVNKKYKYFIINMLKKIRSFI
jgi:lipid II:glycine glycyltransferase (peptidoglycan interpeptide bridge formation enzyme)